MYRVTVTTVKADAFGPLPNGVYTFPTQDNVPTYAEVAGMLISERIRERILRIDVQHVFMGRVTHRFVRSLDEIVEV